MYVPKLESVKQTYNNEMTEFKCKDIPAIWYTFYYFGFIEDIIFILWIVTA